MIISCPIHLCTFLPLTWSEIDLTSNDRMNPLSLCLFIESDCTVHNTVIGHGDCIHAELFGSSHKIFDAARSIQQTILCMYMQMRKGHRCIHLFSF